MADAWDARYAAGPLYHGVAPAPSFALPPGALVLDLGCGAGKSLTALHRADRRWTLCGLDASRPALRRARAAMRPARLVQGDACALPIRDGACSAVRIDHLLGHLAGGARRIAAAEAERVLRPGGWIEARELARGDVRDRGAPEDVRGGLAAHCFDAGELARLFPGCAGEAQVLVRPVRYHPRGRRVAHFLGRRA